MSIDDVRDINKVFTQNKLGHNKIKCSDLYDYQEMLRIKYPDEWERKFKNKWPIYIIYYDKNNNVNCYSFYVYRYSSMANIMSMFQNYLLCQKKTLINCFGYDIAENIMNYMPTILDNNDIVNNYIYVHIRPYSKIKFGDEHIIHITERIKVPNDMSVNGVHGLISFVGLPQECRYTVLRLRARPCHIIKSF